MRLKLPIRESERLEVGQEQVRNWGTEPRVWVLIEKTEYQRVRTNEKLLRLDANNDVDIGCHL